MGAGRVLWFVASVSALLAALARAQDAQQVCSAATTLKQQVESLASVVAAGGSAARRQYEELLVRYRRAQQACDQLTGRTGPGAATIDPLEFLDLIADLPPEEQRNALRGIGEALEQDGSTQCNVFGGEGACMDLPADSPFARRCPGHPLKVDCAFYTEALAEGEDDPDADIDEEIAEDDEERCPQCETSYNELWCHQTVPTCGSFQTTVEAHILPAMKVVVQRKQAGDTGAVAAAAAVPHLIQAVNKVWPCRNVCEAVMQSCGCGDEKSFGDLITLLQRRGSVVPFLEQVPPETLQSVLSSIWDTPLCQLYAEPDAPGFAGYCPAEYVPPPHCGWCDDGNDDLPDFVEEMVANTVADTLYDLLEGAGGLLEDVGAIGEGEDDWYDDWDDNYGGDDDDGDGEGGASSSRSAATLAGLMAFLVIVVVGGVGAAVYMRWRQSSDQGLVPQFLARYQKLGTGGSDGLDDGADDGYVPPAI